MKAWQRVIRERRATEEHRENLFGAYWEALDLEQAEVPDR
jgi:hypothetical protein